MTNEERPPKPEAPEGKIAVWVKTYSKPSYKNGEVIPGHWRLRNAKGTRKGKKRGPKPGIPRMTTSTHAAYVYEQLAVPLAYFTAISPDLGFGPKHEAIRACIKAIDDARVFVNRFTGGHDVEETGQD